jgi:hypothetical protein
MKFITTVLLSLALVSPLQGKPLDTKMAEAARLGSDRIVFEYAKDVCPDAVKFTAVSNVTKGMNFIADEARRAKFTPEQHTLLTYMCGIYALGFHDSAERTTH